ncbi:MAG: hypothetical protein A3G18_12770 [Rhodospirillales bacterium RIFCSPLOWO2_12_FULL_58_28]|nr:MAG: hypothetical protein A3H92_10175 [Rhodospirillales bacterium RIFCSPLOWO2_02_FULL_58_16]OHC77139.1 MAG: hypothetical protein A3G18_12770 [Rhodospirillales bacterium RIFCSPLOWO2_12_FULL_58_28]
MTILSPVDTRSIGNILLSLQLNSFNAHKVELAQKTISSDTKQKINAINLEAGGFQALRKELSAATDFIERVVARGDAIDSLLNNMVTGVWNAQYGDSASFPGHASAFDALLKRINYEAESTRDTPNLLGSTPQSDFSYRYQTNGATNSVGRSFIGYDYTIKEAGDYIWRRDRDLNQFKRFVDSTGVYTGAYVSLSSGAIQLDSFTASTAAVTFTTGFDTSDATQYSGTITRSGLGVLDSWFYEGLSTADGRSRAAADLHAAEITLDSILPTFRSALDSALFYLTQTDNEIAGFNSLIDEKTAASLIKMKAAEDNGLRLNNLNLSIIESQAYVRNLYLDAISLGKNTDLVKALIDVVA